MAPPLLLLLLSLLIGSNARRCCTEDYFFNTTTGICETHDFLNYTSLFVNYTENPEPPNCEIPEDTCFGVFNNTLVNVGCNETNPFRQPARLRVCCPHRQFYSRELRICLKDTDNQRIDQLLADSIREKFALLVHGPLDKCRFDNAILDVIINSSQMILDESAESGFYIEGHPELTGEKCLAVSDDDESLVVRVCMPKSFACSSGQICYRRCCSDGMASYGKVLKCRPRWQILDLEIYQRNDSTGNLTQIETPSSYSLLHGLNCLKYRLDPNYTSDKWHLLKDGRLLKDEDNVVIENDQFCIENIQSDIYPHGLTGLMCMEKESQQPMYYIKEIGCTFSCLFLLLTIIIYLIVPRLFNLHGKTLICYALWMFIFYMLVICSMMHFLPSTKNYCYYVGYGIYFSFLSAMTWMNVRCFDIWWTIGRSSRSGHTSKNSKRQMERHCFFMYFLYATGLPIAIISLCLLIQNSPIIPENYKPNMAEHGFCHFAKDGYGQLIYNVVPLAIMLSANTIFFILTVRNFLKIRNEIEKIQDIPTTKEGKKQKLQNDKAKFFTNAKLFVVMGVVFIFEVLGLKLYHDHWVWYFPDIINSLHGLLIFVIYVCKKDIIKDLRKVMNKSQQVKKTSTSETISTITTSSNQTQL